MLTGWNERKKPGLKEQGVFHAAEEVREKREQEMRMRVYWTPCSRGRKKKKETNSQNRSAEELEDDFYDDIEEEEEEDVKSTNHYSCNCYHRSDWINCIHAAEIIN